MNYDRQAKRRSARKVAVSIGFFWQAVKRATLSLLPRLPDGGGTGSQSAGRAAPGAQPRIPRTHTTTAAHAGLHGTRRRGAVAPRPWVICAAQRKGRLRAVQLRPQPNPKGPRGLSAQAMRQQACSAPIAVTGGPARRARATLSAHPFPSLPPPSSRYRQRHRITKQAAAAVSSSLGATRGRTLKDTDDQHSARTLTRRAVGRSTRHVAQQSPRVGKRRTTNGEGGTRQSPRTRQSAATTTSHRRPTSPARRRLGGEPAGQAQHHTHDTHAKPNTRVCPWVRPPSDDKRSSGARLRARLRATQGPLRRRYAHAHDPHTRTQHTRTHNTHAHAARLTPAPPRPRADFSQIHRLKPQRRALDSTSPQHHRTHAHKKAI